MSALFALALVVGVPTDLGWGDGVRAQDTVSVVDTVVPVLPAGVRIDIVGGDAFVRVRAAGHLVEVDGYGGEKYLRIDPDGTARENTASRTSALNSSRTTGPAVGTGAAGERWEVTGHDGTVMWHDHRVHWMGRSKPVPTGPGGEIQQWSLEVKVDGTPHVVSGRLVSLERASVMWWLVAAVAAGLLACSLRRPRLLATGLLLAASVSVTAGVLEVFSQPSGARVPPVLVVFGLVSLGAAVASVLALRQGTDGEPRVWVFAAGAGASMCVSTWLTAGQVRAAWIPVIGPDWIARVSVTAAAGCGAVALVAGVVRTLRY